MPAMMRIPLVLLVFAATAMAMPGQAAQVRFECEQLRQCCRALAVAMKKTGRFHERTILRYQRMSRTPFERIERGGAYVCQEVFYSIATAAREFQQAGRIRRVPGPCRFEALERRYRWD
jgi:hypothetical protein